MQELIPALACWRSPRRTVLPDLTDEARVNEMYAAAVKLVNDSSTDGDRIGSDVIPKEKEHFVYVQNIAKTATKADVRRMFMLCGQVEDVVIVPKKDMPSFGYVYFKTREGAENAVAMKFSELCGEGILVKMGDPNAGGKESDVDSKGSKGSGSSSGPIRRDKEGRQHPYKIGVRVC